jgi:hypothetical protein
LQRSFGMHPGTLTHSILTAGRACAMVLVAHGWHCSFFAASRFAKPCHRLDATVELADGKAHL